MYHLVLTNSIRGNNHIISNDLHSADKKKHKSNREGNKAFHKLFSFKFMFLNFFAVEYDVSANLMPHWTVLRSTTPSYFFRRHRAIRRLYLTAIYTKP